jgi:hypothetical protein
MVRQARVTIRKDYNYDTKHAMFMDDRKTDKSAGMIMRQRSGFKLYVDRKGTQEGVMRLVLERTNGNKWRVKQEEIQ